MMHNVNTCSRDDDSYDYGDETADNIDYEYDWSEREEVTTSTMNVNKDVNLENIGVEIRVGSHIEENNDTAVINEAIMKKSSNYTNYSDIQVGTSVNSEKPTKISKGVSIESQGLNENLTFEILPTPSAIEQTTAKINDLKTDHINTYSSNSTLTEQYNDSNYDAVDNDNDSLLIPA